MNIETSVLVDDVVERIQHALRANDHPAIIVIEGENIITLSDSAYLRDRPHAEAFEQRAAAEARTAAAERLALAVPQVMTPVEVADGEDMARFRSPFTGPLRDGEQEAILWMAYDTGEGVNYGVIAYTRRSDGRPDFGDPDEMVSVAVNPAAGLPGLTLLRLLLDENLRPRQP